eukprot:TRINITY_DN2618_c0_g1_i1.p1 TRINITY_DN2618_c0_g1~~TRINITY_DN2618_c0_g1_i1.p1  ORF type:complete len:1084 (+),score=254.07 TRINITY_DN2618_c0_g1_i1:167-3253(+)
MKVLISGMKGVGVEVAKNTILCGPGFVTLHDTGNLELRELSSNFYATEEQVGKNRAENVYQPLSELNPWTTTDTSKAELTTDFLKNYNVVLLIDYYDEEKLREFGDFCHKNGIVFIHVNVKGVFAKIFCDFGEVHEVTDPDGEPPAESVVIDITKGNPTIVVVSEKDKHGLHADDYVNFGEVRGMTELNWDGSEDASNAAIKVTKIQGNYTFFLDVDSTNWGDYQGPGGIVRQVKVKSTHKFRSYGDSQKYLTKNNMPQFLIADWNKIEAYNQYHFFYIALSDFQKAHDGRLPKVGDDEEYKEVLASVTKLNEAGTKLAEEEKAGFNEQEKKEGKQSQFVFVEKVDEDLLKQFLRFAGGELNPVAAFVGGFVAQEIIKATGRFVPLQQYYYYDCVEALPNKEALADAADFVEEGTRYDGQVHVFGKKFQQKLQALNVFMIGAGALGCEFFKNFAIMGVGCSDEGLVTVTDMDNIEKSNLSRQFLFRSKDVGEMKAPTAAASVKAMNPAFHCKTSEIAVGPKSEDIWNKEFWDKQDMIIAAVDNEKARYYIDLKCVEYRKPLLESGTLGARCHSSVIIPHLTLNYGAERNPPADKAAMCTVKLFPYKMEHSIEWARDLFAGEFVKPFMNVKAWLENAEFLDDIDVEALEGMDSILTLYKNSRSFSGCLQAARLKWEKLFNNVILQLLHSLPADMKTQYGTLFWAAPKRCPKALLFDANIPSHIGFVTDMAHILADCLALDAKDRDDSPENVKKVIAAVKIDDWKPKDVKMNVDEDNDKIDIVADGDEAEDTLKKKIIAVGRESLDKKKFVAASFEKDIDTNHHVAFMMHASNLRAANYDLGETDFITTKKVAGRITPAISTATACITGAVMIELYKYLQDDKRDVIESYRNAYVDLRAPSSAVFEPLPCPKNKSDPKATEPTRCWPEGWTLWDDVVIDEGDLTFQQLFDYFAKHNLKVLILTASSKILYMVYTEAHKERLPLKVSEYVLEKYPEVISEGKYIDLAVQAEDTEDDDLDVITPNTVRLKFK